MAARALEHLSNNHKLKLLTFQDPRKGMPCRQTLSFPPLPLCCACVLKKLEKGLGPRLGIATVRMLINDVGSAEKMIARGGSMPLLSST